MNFLNVILTLFISSVGIFFYRMTNYSLIDISEIEKCPYCFGTDLCEELKQDKFKLRYTSFREMFANYFSVKNVYYADYNNNSVVLKKLAHDYEFNNFDDSICRRHGYFNGCDLTKLMLEKPHNNRDDKFNFIFEKNIGLAFQDCTLSFPFIKQSLLQYSSTDRGNTSLDTLAKHIWTSLTLNVEPVLIQLLSYEDHWPVPKYLGSCGRLIIENNCGLTLNEFTNADWYIRAKIALQVLQAAENFTFRHPFLRFYLTDISPDNIAVDTDLRVTFVDLEHVIVTDASRKENAVYHSIHIEDENNFAFFDESICRSSWSDHNHYAVCRLLLSKDAPWPMMKGGLLHTPPDELTTRTPKLFELIESCVDMSNHRQRFETTSRIMRILNSVLHTKAYRFNNVTIHNTIL